MAKDRGHENKFCGLCFMAQPSLFIMHNLFVNRISSLEKKLVSGA